MPYKVNNRFLAPEISCMNKQKTRNQTWRPFNTLLLQYELKLDVHCFFWPVFYLTLVLYFECYTENYTPHIIISLYIEGFLESIQNLEKQNLL